MSKVKVGINGFGRIGRIVFRESFNRDNVEVVAINDLLDVDHLAYLLKYDSVHGRFAGTVEVKEGKLYVNGKHIRITAERDPANLKWNEVDVDVVAECTGFFTTIETAMARSRGRVQHSDGIREARRLLQQLTARESEIVDAIVAGRSSRQIADALSVSQRTVEAHRANVLQKLGISNTASLVRLAVLAGLGPPQG